MCVPHADTLVKRSCRNEAVIGRNGNRSDTILDRQVENLLVALQIPKTDTAVTAARRDDAAIASEVQRVDVLLVAGELVFDSAARNVPYLHVISKKDLSRESTLILP